MPDPVLPAIPTLQQDAPCIRCHYNLRGLPLDSLCPECSTPLRDSIPLSPDQILAPTPLAGNVPCIRCRYNLRGLSPSGLCPECGTSILQSLLADRLAYSSPQYLALLDRALLWLIAAHAGGLVLAVALIALSGAWFYGPSVNLVVTAAAGVLLSVAATIGYWSLTAPDPAQASLQRAAALRNTIRITALIILSARTLALAATLVIGGPGSALLAMFGLALPIFLATLVQLPAALAYTRWLARRIPNPPLAGRALTYAILLPILYALLNLPFTCIGLVGFSTSPGYLVVSIVYLIHLIHLINFRAILNRTVHPAIKSK